jgi:ADP-heptose:LPS heptosyltransferase
MRFSALGDVALLLPLLRAMKTRPTIVTSPLGRALLADEFDDFLLLPSKRLPDVLRLIAQLRRRRLDLLVDLRYNHRTRAICFLSGTRACHVEHDPTVVLPGFVRIRNLLASAGLLNNLDLQFQPKPRNYIVLNAGSSPRWQSKRLPDGKWREIADVLRARFGLPLVLTGSSDETDYIARVADAIGPPAENRAGRTSLPELKRLLADAWLVVSTDSAAMHIAAAMKTPTIGIFGATNWLRSAPFGPWSTAIFDRTFYPDAQPHPRNRQERLNYYDHVDIREGLDRLAPFLGDAAADSPD